MSLSTKSRSEVITGLTSMVSRKHLRSERGFTMIEMLVSISILSVVMAAMFAFLWGASKYWQSGQDVSDVTENARLGLNRMTRELKQGSVVNLADEINNKVVFTVNFGDGDGDETVTYGFTPGTGGDEGFVWRTSSAGSQPVTLVNNVDAAKFVFYGNDYRCDADNNGLVYLGKV